MREAMRALGVSRQTVLQRVKRGELAAVHIMRRNQKGLRIKVIGPTARPLRPYLMNQGALCSTFQAAADIGHRHVFRCSPWGPAQTPGILEFCNNQTKSKEITGNQAVTPMTRGGRRSGAGRKKGALSQKTRVIAARAAAEGITPLGASARSPTKNLSMFKRQSQVRGRCRAWQVAERHSGRRSVWGRLGQIFFG
jgi:hypothetical protein